MKYVSLKKIYYTDKKNYENIYRLRVESEAAIHFDFEIGKNKAFVLVNSEILDLVTKIQAIDKQLSETISNGLPKMALGQYAIQSLVLEIQQTNEIEQVNSTRKEIADTIEKIRKKDFSGRMNGLINKYLRFMSGKKIELSNCQDIRDLYDEIVLDEVIKTNPKNIPDGVIFRKGPNVITKATDKVIHSGVYPERKIIDYMTKALSVLNDRELNYYISIPVFHYMFEYIHPFYDGNGRMGRFISGYSLSENLNYLVSYRLSYKIKENLKKYYESFETANDPKNMGELTGFVIQFLEFVYEDIKELKKDLEYKKTTFKQFEEALEKLSLSAEEKKLSEFLLIGSLFYYRGFTVLEICDSIPKKPSTVYNMINSINSKHPGIVRKMPFEKNKKVYDIDLTVLENYL